MNFPSVFNSKTQLPQKMREGFEFTWIRVRKLGIIDPAKNITWNCTHGAIISVKGFTVDSFKT